ncbi:SulP family inorganic anion transporter [Candidatus Chloroploca sp. M-50]|uniref:SulP family inorganic anion transporter n=1 Tax=Candidatus Chloroploca mongolica TaxID=2528176 RepID=A0ABS4DD43_9CHLR|nr:SulP family inorganic anion transporter [Candidatus Chloroploca mongolica]MBP1467234.1 SulP family inorganic anion transporter [Candidatus Chloroploca mongolica]
MNLPFRGRQFFNRATVREDLSAGLVLGIQSIPGGLAAGLLALVNPVYGLYSYMTGVITGAFFTSSVFMSVQATSAMALIIASVPLVTQASDPNVPLFTLALLTGVLMLAAGLFKLGQLVRFVPNSVMVGFVNAVALLIILGQLDDFTGYNSSGPNRVVRTFDLLRNMEQVHVPTLAAGVLTIILILTLERTQLKALGMVIALFFVSLIVPLAGAEQIALARDIADIPSSLPMPVLPSLALVPVLLIPALSLAFVGLVQGASISASVANPDGRFPNASGDFVGQGAAGIVAGVLQGMPVGASMSATSLVIGAGARSRLANIVAGIVIALGILLFGRLVGLIAMPALAGLLIVIGFRTLRLSQVVTVWKTGVVQQTVMLLTFSAGLLVPLQYAVLMGVGLAVLLYVFQQSNRVRVVTLKIEPGQFPVEGEPPAEVPGRQVTILVPYGSLFFAAAPVFNAQLPTVTESSRNAVVILVLRGETELGSTFMDVIARYAEALRGQNSRLMLSGVAPSVEIQLERTGLLYALGRKNIFIVDERVGHALQEAMDAAERWIDAQPLAGRT